MSYVIYKQQLLNVPLTLEHCVNVCKVKVCYCTINTMFPNPFLEFKLLKNDRGVLTFESFNAKIIKNIDIRTFIMQNRPQTPIDDILGYIIFKDELYCFIKFESKSDKLYKASDTHGIVLADEIINRRQYFNIPIDDSVYMVFIKNPHCLYLKSEQGKQLIQPKAYYYGDTSMKKKYLLDLGIPKQVYLGIFGSYYYVSSFNDAVINAGWTPDGKQLVVNNVSITSGKHGKYIQGAIYRAFLFIERTECKLSKTPDTSPTTNLLIAQSSDYAKKNIHVSNRGGKWSAIYDTIYSGSHPDLPANLIAHKTPISIYNYVELNMMSLPMKKTENYKSIQIK